MISSLSDLFKRLAAILPQPGAAEAAIERLVLIQDISKLDPWDYVLLGGRIAFRTLSVPAPAVGEFARCSLWSPANGGTHVHLEGLFFPNGDAVSRGFTWNLGLADVPGGAETAFNAPRDSRMISGVGITGAGQPVSRLFTGSNALVVTREGGAQVPASASLLVPISYELFPRGIFTIGVTTVDVAFLVGFIISERKVGVDESRI